MSMHPPLYNAGFKDGSFAGYQLAKKDSAAEIEQLRAELTTAREQIERLKTTLRELVDSCYTHDVYGAPSGDALTKAEAAIESAKGE